MKRWRSGKKAQGPEKKVEKPILSLLSAELSRILFHDIGMMSDAKFNKCERNKKNKMAYLHIICIHILDKGMPFFSKFAHD